MKKFLSTVFSFLACSLSISFLSSCEDAKSYAEYVKDEENYIQRWIDYNDYEIAERFDEEQLSKMATKILEDSISPSEFIQLGKWYEVTEGDFKRLLFKINDWGKGYPDMKSKNKFYEDENVLVRYENLLCISEYDYSEGATNISGDNLEPENYKICYNWRRNYYSNTYYSYSYSSGSSYECTSGGLGFPIRFLWQGGDASIICPFNLIPSNLSSYYYTLYYGNIRYTKPNYIPQQ